MTTSAKLFTAPLNLGKETERAAVREKHFNEEYSDLQATWYARLVEAGMDANHVYDKHGRRDEAKAYSESQETIYARAARFEHVADESDFQTKHENNPQINKRIWHLYAVGQTEDEIADNVDLSRRTVRQKLNTLQKRQKLAAEAGKLLATNDSKAEVLEFNRLQALGRKHLALIKSGKLGETIVDSVTNSGALVPTLFDQDSIDALNSTTAWLALAFASNK